MNKENWSFGELIDRHETQSVKWDTYNKDLLPLWVADMDFKAPEPVINAIINRAKHGIFGYSFFFNAYYDAVLGWFKRHYNWEIKRKWLCHTPGVIPAINLALQTYSNPGDKVIIQNPVYYPFFGAIKNSGCQILVNPLISSNGHFQMDYDDLKEKVKDPRAKILILCNPHNPIGRVWNKEELTQLGEICIDNDILVIADEIHCDLIYPGYKHTNFASICKNFAMNSITCTSLSKTFNLAGLQLSNIIIPNQKLKHSFRNTIQSLFHPGQFGYLPNTLSLVAFTAAYKECDAWLNSLIQYLHENLKFLKTFIKQKIPQIEIIEPEGTYLVWLDFRKVGIAPNQLEKFLHEKAKVALDEGSLFGNGGEGFQRINIACPRSTLEKALERILRAVKEIKS